MDNDLSTLTKCNKCKWLCKHRIQVVPGKGPLNSPVILLGESPGLDESKTGEPFIGRCGDLLSKMLQDAGVSREKLYITNTTKCRPTREDKGQANRAPSSEEITNCKPWLWEEIKAIKPKLIITLGRIPTNTLLKLKTSITLSDIVGKEYYVDWNGLKVTIVPTYHPSYLLVHRKDLVVQTTEHLKMIKEYL